MLKVSSLALTVIAACAIGLAAPVLGQDQQAAADRAKQAQNPIASLITHTIVPVQYRPDLFFPTGGTPKGFVDLKNRGNAE